MNRLRSFFPSITLPRDRSVVAILCLLGLIQAAIYAHLAHISSAFTYDAAVESRPILQVLLLLGVASVLYFLSIALVWKPPRATPKSPGYTAFNRRIMLAILGFACLFRLLMWWSHPIQEVDIYRYLWDGRVAAVGVPPYRFTLTEIEQHRDAPNLPEHLQNLADLTDRSEPVATIFSRVRYRDIPAVYPPLSQAIFATVARITPEQAPVATQLRIMKAVLLLFDLATIALVIAILRNLQWPVRRVLVYAWCPLILKEFANSGHFDSIAVCLLAAAVWLVIRNAQRWYPRPVAAADIQSSACIAAILWAGATLAKLYPIVLLPIFARAWWNQLRWRFIAPLFVYAVTLTAIYGPILAHIPNTPADNLIADHAGNPIAILPTHHPLEGISTYVNQWAINDLLFALVVENLKPDSATSEHPSAWFTITPPSWRLAFNEWLGSRMTTLGLNPALTEPSFLAAQLFSGLVLIVFSVWLVVRCWPGDYRLQMIQSLFLTLAALWYLSPAQNPWHWAWALPFAIFVRTPWLLVSACALLYYLRFWLLYHHPDTTLLGTPYTGAPFFDFVIVWFEHLPVLALIFLAARLKRYPVPQSFPELEPQESHA